MLPLAQSSAPLTPAQRRLTGAELLPRGGLFWGIGKAGRWGAGLAPHLSGLRARPHESSSQSVAFAGLPPSPRSTPPPLKMQPNQRPIHTLSHWGLQNPIRETAFLLDTLEFQGTPQGDETASCLPEH